MPLCICTQDEYSLFVSSKLLSLSLAGWPAGPQSVQVCPQSQYLTKLKESEDMVGVAIAGAAAAPLVVTAALGAVGFGAGGVIAGSIAAGWQAAVGNVVAGSAFAAAQSAAAAGLGAAGAAAGAAAGGAGAAAVGGGYLTSAASLASWGWVLYLAPVVAAVYSLVSRD